jgi:hypothetical protein
MRLGGISQQSMDERARQCGRPTQDTQDDVELADVEIWHDVDGTRESWQDGAMQEAYRKSLTSKNILIIT